TSVPPRWTVAPDSRAHSYTMPESTGQKGSAKPQWTTTPPSKKELTRLLVRSISWSGTTRWSGAISSRRLPTALIERIQRTPSTPPGASATPLAPQLSFRLQTPEAVLIRCPEHAILRHDPRDESARSHVECRIEDPDAFGRCRAQAKGGYLVRSALLDWDLGA